MRRLVAAVVASLIPTLVSAAPHRLPDYAGKETLLGWINVFRHNPDPDRVPTAVRVMSRLGLLSDPESAGVYVGFLAGVIAANPDKAEALIGRMFPLSSEHHWAIVRAVAYSGRPEWQALLRRVADRMPQRRVMIERFLDGKLPTLDQAPIEKDATWESSCARSSRSPSTSAKRRPRPGSRSPPTCSTRSGATITRPETTGRSRASS